MDQNKIRGVIELEDPYELFETLDEKDFYLLPSDKKEKDAFLQAPDAEKPIFKIKSVVHKAKKSPKSVGMSCVHVLTDTCATQEKANPAPSLAKNKLSQEAESKTMKEQFYKKPSKLPSAKQLTQLEMEFIQSIVDELPPIIARKKVEKYLGGIIATQTLSNADSCGEGPEVAYRIGRSVVYTTKTLLIWIVQHFGVEKLATANANKSLGRS